jgi:hypothetical protein
MELVMSKATAYAVIDTSCEPPKTVRKLPASVIAAPMFLGEQVVEMNKPFPAGRYALAEMHDDGSHMIISIPKAGEWAAGTVKFFSRRTGYGFVLAPAGGGISCTHQRFKG